VWGASGARLAEPLGRGEAPQTGGASKSEPVASETVALFAPGVARRSPLKRRGSRLHRRGGAASPALVRGRAPLFRETAARRGRWTESAIQRSLSRLLARLSTLTRERSGRGGPAAPAAAHRAPFPAGGRRGGVNAKRSVWAGPLAGGVARIPTVLPSESPREPGTGPAVPRAAAARRGASARVAVRTSC